MGPLNPDSLSVCKNGRVGEGKECGPWRVGFHRLKALFQPPLTGYSSSVTSRSTGKVLTSIGCSLRGLGKLLDTFGGWSGNKQTPQKALLPGTLAFVSNPPRL